MLHSVVLWTLLLLQQVGYLVYVSATKIPSKHAHSKNIFETRETKFNFLKGNRIVGPLFFGSTIRIVKQMFCCCTLFVGNCERRMPQTVSPHFFDIYTVENCERCAPPPPATSAREVLQRKGRMSRAASVQPLVVFPGLR